MSEPGGIYSDQPSPEDVFAGHDAPKQVNVYLTDVDPSAVATVLRGLRAGLRVLDPDSYPDRVPLADAEAILARFNDGERPALIGLADNPEHARAVAQTMVETARQRLQIGIGLTDADIEQIKAESADEPEPDEPPQRPEGPMSPLSPPLLVPEGEDPDSAPSLAACKMAIALMAQHEGNGTRALIWARILAETTGDGDWTGAARLILASLPLKDPSA